MEELNRAVKGIFLWKEHLKFLLLNTPVMAWNGLRSQLGSSRYFSYLTQNKQSLNKHNKPMLQTPHQRHTNGKAMKDQHAPTGIVWKQKQSFLLNASPKSRKRAWEANSASRKVSAFIGYQVLPKEGLAEFDSPYRISLPTHSTTIRGTTIWHQQHYCSSIPTITERRTTTIPLW